MDINKMIENRKEYETNDIRKRIVQKMIDLEYINLIKGSYSGNSTVMYATESFLNTSKNFERLYIALDSFRKGNYDDIDKYFSKYFDEAYDLVIGE